MFIEKLLQVFALHPLKGFVMVYVQKHEEFEDLTADSTRREESYDRQVTQLL